MQVIFSKEAERQIFRMFQYITQAASPRIAANYLERLRRECESLGVSPQRGQLCWYKGYEYRKIGFEGRVTILFEVGRQSVSIAAILGYGRNAIRPR